MAEEWDYGNEWGATYDPWYPDVTNGGGVTDYFQSPAYQQFTGWGDPTGVGSSGDTSFSGEGSGWWNTILGGLGQVGSFLGNNAGTLGPLLSGAGSIAGGAIGSNAANEAARLQAEALNRGIDLQTAQWLQQQGNLAPYLQAGQQGLSQLQQLAGREQPGLPGATPAFTNAGVPLPSVMPGWTPQTYGGYTPGATPEASQYGYQGPQAPGAEGYRWTPGQGPSAADYRYTPGQTPDAAGYGWTPGQAPSAAQYRYTAGAVPTLSGKELLANDPGVQFRQDEARKALEGSAAARGDLLSGGNLKALQSRSQDLASQEYGQAWNRASQQAQLREQWGQAESQMGFGQAAEEARLREGWAQQAGAQNFGQAMSAAQLREQLQQVATQQGWSQAQTEAVFREQMAQQASQQGLSQALAAQGQQWQQGMAGQQFDWSRAMQEAQQRAQEGQFAWQAGTQAGQLGQKERQSFETDLYNRLMSQNQLQYARDMYGNETDYTRQQALYRQQLAQHLLPWEQQSTLATLGGQAVGMYGTQGQSAANSIATLLGRVGTAQGEAAAGSGLNWQRALTGAGNQIRPLLSGLNA